ncbi:MAG: AarF/ABC1/UbiB kinase family protein [Deltaproteobacteria bacterium]|nr:AarF/ABC1/UbiB kinase family protein [Deltaproteobacteria bacterium]
MARGPLSSLGRFRHIAAVVARHGLGHFLDRQRSRARARAGELPPVAETEVGSAAARRFRAILEDLGPTFIKFGQVLSTRADLLPPGFAETLATLQDDCPPMAAADVERALTLGLGKPIAELFSEFETKPVASASIAQVHRAVTKDGQEVAVKIQRLGIKERIYDDLDFLRYLARLVESIVQESGVVTPAAIVDEFENVFLAELDFEREAKMIGRFRAHLEGKERHYVVPKVFEALSSRTVLTMEFIHGTRISQLTSKHDPKVVCSHIVSTAFEQMFVDGLFHADPHPGNLWVLDDNRLALLDFGCVGQISFAMRETLVVLAVSIGMRDADTVSRLLYRVGIPERRISLHQLRDACASLFDQYLSDQTTLAHVEAAQLLKELFDLAARFRVRIPSEYALIARASVVVEGIIRKLDPELDVLQTAGPYVRRLIREELAVPNLQDDALKNLVRARGFMRELPLTAAQILMDLEGGKLQIQFENPRLETIARNIDALGVTVFMGLIAGGLVGGSFSFLGRYNFERWGLPVIPVLGFFVAAILLGGAMGRYVFAPRVRRISVGRWLRGRTRR